jgi:hypothetical protein
MSERTCCSIFFIDISLGLLGVLGLTHANAALASSSAMRMQVYKTVQHLGTPFLSCHSAASPPDFRMVFAHESTGEVVASKPFIESPPLHFKPDVDIQLITRGRRILNTPETDSAEFKAATTTCLKFAADVSRSGYSQGSQNLYDSLGTISQLLDSVDHQACPVQWKQVSRQTTCIRSLAFVAGSPLLVVVASYDLPLPEPSLTTECASICDSAFVPIWVVNEIPRRGPPTTTFCQMNSVLAEEIAVFAYGISFSVFREQTPFPSGFEPSVARERI